MMFWKLLHRFLDDSPQIAFPVEIVRSHPGVFELERSVIIVPAALQLLEKDQGAPRTVPKLDTLIVSAATFPGLAGTVPGVAPGLSHRVYGPSTPRPAAGVS